MAGAGGGGGAGNPGGTSGQIQYNNAGAFGGVTAVLAANGGTGNATNTAHAVLIGEGTSAVAFATIGTAGRLLVDQGASADPAFFSTGLALNQTTKLNTADSDGSTITFNLATSDYHSVTLGGSRTLALSNATTGQPFTIRLQQAAAGGPYTPTWFAGITWFGTPGFTFPPFPTTASAFQKCTFYCTGTNTYDGHWCGNSAS